MNAYLVIEVLDDATAQSIREKLGTVQDVEIRVAKDAPEEIPPLAQSILRGELTFSDWDEFFAQEPKPRRNLNLSSAFDRRPMRFGCAQRSISRQARLRVRRPGA